MRRFMFILSILSVPVLAAFALASTTADQKSHTARPVPPMVEQIRLEQFEIQTATVEFATPVKMLGAILKGSYLFLHDDGKMSRGEPCTWVYGRGEAGNFDELVASFHCLPVEWKEPAEQFQVILSGVTSSFTMPELIEYRFAESNEGHRVPKAE